MNGDVRVGIVRDIQRVGDIVAVGVQQTNRAALGP